jgi:stalled ribosome rescue protein Dom34
MQPKNKFNPQKKAGIWIDQEKAYIFKIKGEEEPVMEKINSGVELRNRIAGEKEEVTRFGNVILGEREKKQRRQRTERAKYYENVISHIRDADYCQIFGPGETKHQLAKAIRKDNTMKAKVLAVENSGQLTLNQMTAKVKDFFTAKEI